ncbi:hypothetical protein QVD17_29558 [Tagetes erecta]|uniref:VWFA domain-containing protein n=1 Tax=Tagetes erecta TaxID=13708 RepID=A0AAD8NM51_TARER|nr:hypothetical protein QVD17_29558 [Tagetes erecta]
MCDDFSRGVEDGVRLSKRLYFGKDRSVAPPKPLQIGGDKSSSGFLPLSPMLYAVIFNPGIVDNPDVPSYQPHVHGRCDPPALIPLQMNSVQLNIDSHLDTAFITLTASWRLHCVMGSATCDCRLAIPMGGLNPSILGLQVDLIRRSYTTQLVVIDQTHNTATPKPEDGGFLKPHIFTLTIPQVDGGSNLSVKVRWSQKIIYKHGDFTLDVPFTFPDYVTPAGKKLSKKEKIQLNVNVGLATQIVCRTATHPMKEQKRQVGKLAFLYEAEVLTWSSSDFVFTYSVPTTNAFGGVLLHSPSSLAIDQRDLFSLYLFPGPDLTKQVIRKEVLFVVDISGSMKGRTIEATKNAVIAALSKLNQGDSFSIMAFNDQTYLYSSTLELATEEALQKATDWIGMNFIPGGGTNMSIALDQAIEMLSGSKQALPMIFFLTDGAVENERQICEVMIKQLKNQGSDLCPRVFTFGIGSFCNHYFLRMLAMIGRGHFEAASDPDSIVAQMEVLFSRAASTVLLNIAIDGLDDLDALEVYPSVILDLCAEAPLVVFGHYRGGFPDTLKVKGILADMSNFTIDLKVQQAKEIPLDKVLVKQQIEHYTSQAWFLQDKKLEEKVAKISMQSGVVSEYTRMVLLETLQVQEKHASTSSGTKKGKPESIEIREKCEMIKVLQRVGVGFGNLIATIENTPPGYEPKLPDQAEMLVRAAGNCCVNLFGKCCCMCCIQACSRINDQCAIVVTQLITSLAFLGCFACCELCCGRE